MNDILDAAKSNPREGGPTFTLKHRAFRALWGLVWSLCGVWTPVPLHGWRRFLASAFGARIAPTARIYPGVRIWYPPNLAMGPYATLGPGVNCYAMAPIRLADHAVVSQGAHLCAGTHDILDDNFQLRVRGIDIGADAWIAAEAFVGPGVAIGEGAVLGARGVAMKDLEAGGVYIGNPAVFVKWRRPADAMRGVTAQ